VALLPSVAPPGPKRSRLLHWGAFAGSALSFWLLAIVLLDGKPPAAWAIQLDLVLSAAAAAEFFTRSGLRWDWKRYVLSRFFDFLAMVPALALLGQGLPYEAWWIWLVLAARGARTIDRVLGDGFVQRHALALVEAFEEELTDRVMLRLLNRVEAALAEGRFGESVAQSLRDNKADILTRVREQHPRTGAAAKLANIVGLDEALNQAEERAYDAFVEVAGSREVDRALRDIVAETFANMRMEVTDKKWRRKVGLRPRSEEPVG
jgi:hypothetical protein